MIPIRTERQTRSSLHAFLLTLTLTAAGGAQAAAEGYHSDLVTLPAGVNSLAVVDDGLVWFDGTDLVHVPDGQPQRTLLQFPSSRFGAFTLPIGNGELLFAESSFDELWVVPLDPAGTPRLLTTIAFPYDAVRIGDGRVVVSAKTGGFPSATNDLLAVDLVTGLQTPVGSIPGASGPLVLDQNGDLLYATAPLAFPPPAGSVQILRWAAAQWAFALTGGPQLAAANAQVVRSGIDAAGDLAVDGDDDVLFVDWLNNEVVELDDVHSGAGRHALVGYAASVLSPTLLVYRAGTTSPWSPYDQFEPFAHPGGGSLWVQETDFAGTDQLRRLSARAARIVTSPAGTVPQGTFTLTLEDAAASGLCLFALGTVATGISVPLALPGSEQVARWDAGLLNPLVSTLLPCDASGRATWILNNPGFATGLTVHAQAAFAQPNTLQLGATAPAAVPLGL